MGVGWGRGLEQDPGRLSDRHVGWAKNSKLEAAVDGAWVSWDWRVGLQAPSLTTKRGLACLLLGDT